MREAWRALSVVSLASIFSGMAGSALNVALPTVVRHFDASATAASWILLAFMLANTVLMIFFGRLADMFGRRSMYLMGLATFTLASFLSGLAPNAWTLVGLRVLQAAGAAMLLTNSAAIVTAAFPRHRLGQGMGIYLASFSVAQLLGPTVGGVLAEHAGWRWVFWYNVPIGLICLAWGAWALPRVARTGERQGIDIPGNLLVLVSLGSGLAALSQATTLGWTSWLVIGGLAVFLLGMPLFVLFERRVAHPLVDMTLFRSRPFALGLLASFLNATSAAGVLLLFSLYFQAVKGDDAFSAGIRVLPLAVATLIFSSTSGLFQRRVSPRGLAVVGNLCTGAGLIVLGWAVAADAGYVAIASGLVLAGAGSGLFMPSNTTALMGEIPHERLGIANAMRLMLQQSGFVVGTAIVLSVLTAPLAPELRQYAFAGTLSDISGSALDDLLLGYRYTLLTMLTLSVATTVTSLAARHATINRRRRGAAQAGAPSADG
ncbi:DHA2 family efflux MFS transporter permease subunit [Blastococcus sp. CCUG 61487]|uniref:DHA2 family efflux MFS transporter permease subunit n=1 Tax=Blastococcus sp. CCUG 61487 TaxID=1840703 RepID=UPI0010C0030A|nr:DHA2 family efflux MFS transporter permease subunit [Blastococcus sp. CCUG 61487]TKJ24822.1 MFS transporter [Blastococcus sp. CCUG 61487]